LGRLFSWILAVATLLFFFGSGQQAYAHPRNPHPPAPAPRHLTVKFDYDFSHIPACAATVKTKCIQQFIVYDISAGPLPSQRFELFVIPAPPGSTGAVKGITGTSPQLLSFESGQHLIAVTAQMPGNTETDPSACTVWITVP
jgi:hypothetical protein